MLFRSCWTVLPLESSIDAFCPGNTGLMMSKHHQAPAKLLISDVGWYLRLAAVSGFGSNLGKKQHDITNQRASELSDPILHFLLRDLPISTKTGSILCDIILTSDDVHCLEPGSSNSEDVSSHLFLAHVCMNFHL